VKATTYISLVLVVTTAICTIPSTARAQINSSQRPYKALFGGSAADPDIHHSLDVSVSALAGYEDNEMAAQGGVPTSPLYQTGFYSGFSGVLSYYWQGKNVEVGANAGTDGRYYPDQSQFIGVTHYGGIGVAASFGPRTRIAANQSISYSPAYLYGLFPVLGPVTPGGVVGVGDPLGEEHVYVYDTSASLTRDVSRRGSIEVLGSFRYSDYNQSAAIGRDLRSYSVGGRYRHGMTRYASLRLGYIYRKGSYGFFGDINRPVAVHDIDVGVDYRRPLSLTRRTTVDFGAGSSIVNTPAGVLGEPTLQYRVMADVGLTHQMGRTWSARLAYNRGLGFAEGFAQPIFSDAVTGSLSGFFSRRVDFSASGGFSLGDAGLNTGTTGRGFKAYSASARVRYALGSRWALFGESSYYKHDLGNVLIVAEGVPPNLDRTTVRAGLTLWFPIVRR
jgi:hypothetical protein